MSIFRRLVKEDCELLLSRFQQTDSVRFEAFSKIWRDLKFEQIFYGTVKHERRSFSRLVLDTAYPFLLPPFSFQIRAGGLYLLYALYHCQTADPLENICLALKDWEEVIKFEKDAMEAQHFDVVFILKKLMHEKAFVFAAMPRLLVFDKKKKTDQSQACESFMERPSAPQALINVSLLEELSNVHDLYENMKSSICPKSDSSVNLIHPNLVQNLRSSVLDFYSWQQDQFVGGGSSREDDSGEGTSARHESSRRADLLASIKSRAYGQAAEVSKARRHRAVEVDHVTSPESSSAPLSRYRRIKQKTLKYRATNAVQVSGDVWKEASSQTHISHLTALHGAARRKSSAPREKPKPPQSYKKFKWKTENN